MNPDRPLIETISPDTRVVDSHTGREVSGVDLQRMVTATAAQFEAGGCSYGERLAVLAPQTIDWYVVHLAADLLGMLTVPLNTRYTDPEIVGMLDTAEARVIAVDTGFLGRDYAQPVLRATSQHVTDTTVVTIDGPASPGWSSLSELLGHPQAVPPTVGDSRGAVCFGTSGTTSAPKLAVHGRGGVAVHCQAVADRLTLTPADTVLAILPPSGAYGYTVAMAGMVAGARVVLVRNFQPSELGELVRSYRSTFIAVTEAILRVALKSASLESFASLRYLATAGGSLREMALAFDSVGVPLMNVYGASEVLALAALREPGSNVATDGRWTPGGRLVPPGLEVRVVDAAGLTLAGTGDEGELQLKGPTVFTGYLDQPEATESAFEADGWYRSKDLARIDEPGVFTYLARLTDTMRLKGYLVEPAQVETVLLAHADVMEAEVVGIPNPDLGEDQAVAFVVPCSDRTDLTVDGLMAWCRERLAAFKVPSHVFFVEEIPKTPSANGDKALKRDLREQARRLVKGAATS
jgi:fatty-acyl-CoA synthase